jgi:hypothetical protein
MVLNRQFLIRIEVTRFSQQCPDCVFVQGRKVVPTVVMVVFDYLMAFLHCDSNDLSVKSFLAGALTHLGVGGVAGCFGRVNDRRLSQIDEATRGIQFKYWVK